MSRRPITFAVMFALGVLWTGTAVAGPLTPRQIYRQFGKSVVLVFGTDGSAQGSAGTGSIISKDGQIITNAHVVAKNGRPFKKIFVYMKPDKIRGSMKYDLKHRFKAAVVDIDPKLDLALLRMINPPSDLQSIDFVDPEEVEIGEPVVAIGHPETGGLWTLTTGSISSVVADFQGVNGKDVFQTEASVNRGNSGGPLLNAFGQMVGINTCISRKAADGLAITDINFSLKSSVAVEWLKRRRLMTLAYVKPGTAKTPVPGDAGASSAVVAKAKPPKPKTKVKGDDRKTIIAVVEPQGNDDVAQDPEFSQAAEVNVSRGVKISKARKPKKVKPKQLTKHRPYKMAPFVAARIREMRALENMMKEMEGDIMKSRGGKRGKTGDFPL